MMKVCSSLKLIGEWIERMTADTVMGNIFFVKSSISVVIRDLLVSVALNFLSIIQSIIEQ